MLTVRKATEADIDAIAEIYAEIHTCEESGRAVIGWVRDVYPIRATAEAALGRDDLFVAEEDSQIVGAAIINQTQVEEYKNGGWQYDAPDEEVMVLHTLVISPRFSGKGYGKAFVAFYEEYALRENCRFLRIDTNEKNARARAMYRKLNYREAGIVPCDFNGIKGIGLVLLEKKLEI